MTRELCFFVGGVKSPAVQNLVTNLGWMLSEQFDLRLLTTRPTVFTEAESYYQIDRKNYDPTVQGSVIYLREYFQQHDPIAITQLTQPPTHGSIVGLLAKMSDVPYVYRYSGDRFYGYRVRRGWRKWGTFIADNVIGRIPLYLAEKYIVLGPKGKSRLMDRGVPPKDISILPPGIDPCRFDHNLETSIDLNIPDSRSVILFLGRCNRLKGLDTFERTIPQIIDRRDDLQFVMVGTKDSVPDIPARYRDHLTTIGQVPPESVPSYLYHADLLVHPSLTEGLPRAVLEGLFANTPVVARAVGDIPFATTNTFSTDREFIEMVCDFEALDVDDPSCFNRAFLKQTYNDFYAKFI